MDNLFVEVLKEREVQTMTSIDFQDFVASLSTEQVKEIYAQYIDTCEVLCSRMLEDIKTYRDTNEIVERSIGQALYFQLACEYFSK